MPRLKKPETERQRSSRACVHCRKRKERCDGHNPCAACNKRGLRCLFSSLRADPVRERTSSTSQVRAERDEALSDGSTQQPPDSQRPGSSGVAHRSHDRSERTPSEAPVPRSARLLSDGHGKFIYIGDSASISFVQNIRRIVSLKLGDCDFINDIFQHSFLEQPSSASPASYDAYSPESQGLPPKPSLEEASILMDQYLTSVSGLLDIFDEADLRHSFQAWVTSSSYSDTLSNGIFYIILSIGAQNMKQVGFTGQEECYYQLARRNISSLDTEEPCIQTVRCYILIAMYLLGACRRNASYMNLGVAVRAAHALGLHRSDLYSLFSETERRSRDGIWKSLRILDLFLSASLGRPPSTSDFQGDQSSREAFDKADAVLDEPKAFAALSQLCRIFEKILNAVYKNQGVSTTVVDDISSSYRSWAERLPQIPEDSDQAPLALSQILASAHLLGAYHWSIILLTRPFLMFGISSASRDAQVNGRDGIKTPSASTLAHSCVDSAVKALDIADDLLKHEKLPRRLPFVLNTVFNAALAVGVSFFGDYDRHLPLRDAMEKAEKVLSFMQIHDPQAGRYAQILTHLNEAAKSYVARRDHLSMSQHSKFKTSLFGNLETRRARTVTSQGGQRAYDYSQTSRNSESCGTYDSTSNQIAVSDLFHTPRNVDVRGQETTFHSGSTRPTFLSSRMFPDESLMDQVRIEHLNPTPGPLERGYHATARVQPESSSLDYLIPTFALLDGIEPNPSEPSNYRNFWMPTTFP